MQEGEAKWVVHQKPVLNREKNFAEIGRFFGEKSEIGGPGKDFAVEKSEKKKKIGEKSPIFPIKTDFFR